MDNNPLPSQPLPGNPVQPQPQTAPAQPLPAQQPQLSPNQPPAPSVPAQPNTAGSGNKIILWFVIGLILIIFLAGGVYLYMIRQQTNAVPQNPTQAEIPSPTPQENLEETLNSLVVDTATDSADFTAVDQDINQL